MTEFQYALETAGGLVALVLTVELAARWWLRCRRAYYVHPPHLRLRLHLNRHVLPQLEPCARFDVNSEGERGDEVQASQADLYRVLVAGGSVAECYVLDHATSWPGALQRILREPENLRTLETPKVHVGNIARAGIGSEALDLVLDRVLPRYGRLQAIIIMVGVTDLYRWLEHGAPPSAPPPRPSTEIFSSHPDGPFSLRPRRLALTELVRRLRRRWIRPITTREDVGSWMASARTMRARAKEVRATMPDPTGMLDNYEEHLRRLLPKARAKSDRVLLVRHPWFEKDYTQEEAAQLFHGGVGRPWQEDVRVYYSFDIVSRLMGLLDARAERVAEDLRIEHVNLMPIVEPSLTSYFDFCHLAPAGATQVARAVADALLSPHQHRQPSYPARSMQLVE